MPSTHRTHLSSTYRFFLVPALVVAAIVAVAGLGEPLFTTVAMANTETAPASNSISTYRWNLDDAGLPLLSLPQHIRGAVDLSIAYSMDQFQFPLFQSLYYNGRVGKYILMVMPKTGSRVEFVDLLPVNGRSRFAAKGNSNLRLEDKGYAKLLTTGEGTVYTFASVGGGEFHCSQIRDQRGRIINLKYTNDGTIDTIVDVSGRTISFGYENNYVSSITQTWGRGSLRRQTWDVTNNTTRSRPAVQFLPVGAVTSNRISSSANLAYAPAGAPRSKRMPSNALIHSYTPAMAASDSMLASIFGGPGAVAAAHSFEPVGLASQYPIYRGDLIGDDGKVRRGHLSYAMHLYGSADGTRNTPIYVPAGFTSHSSTPTPTDAAITFYYPRLGNLTNVTLAVFHIADFQLSSEGGRVRIGNIGGRGGSISCYKHSHIEIYHGNTGLPSSSARARLRIDPATVFATTSNLASR